MSQTQEPGQERDQKAVVKFACSSRQSLDQEVSTQRRGVNNSKFGALGAVIYICYYGAFAATY